MADFNILDVFQFEESLINNIIWQYDNAEALKSLINSKNEYYSTNLNEFWQQIVNDFLNIQTATDWGLNLWGQILKIKRIYNINGQSVTLSKETFRRVILGKLQLIRSNGTIPEINSYLNFVFKTDETANYQSYAFDNNDMTMQYVLNFEPTQEELALIFSREILPTPAGVLDRLYILEQSAIFGFYGTGFQPFNQAPFWDGRYIG